MKFSVVLCTYNGSEFIKEQIDSIINQTEPIDEIIISDDASQDDTIAIVQSILKNTNIEYKIIVNEKPLGVAENFLKAMRLATGDYIFTSDQDDIWLSNKVKLFKKYIMNSNKSLYFSNGLLVDANDKSLNSTLRDIYKIGVTKKNSYLKIILNHSIVTGAAMCVSKELIDKVNYIPNGILHDEWFSIVAALDESIEAIDEITFHYRQHGKNVVGASKKTFFEKLLIWKNNNKKVKEIREYNFLRTSAIAKIAQKSKYQESVNNAVKFWEGLCNLNNISSLKGIIYICKEYLIGNYSLFYTGTRGFVRDLIKFFV